MIEKNLISITAKLNKFLLLEVNAINCFNENLNFIDSNQSIYFYMKVQTEILYSYSWIALVSTQNDTISLIVYQTALVPHLLNYTISTYLSAYLVRVISEGRFSTVSSIYSYVHWKLNNIELQLYINVISNRWKV